MKNLYRIEGGIVFIATRANGVDLEAKIDLIDLPIIDAYQGTWGAMWSPKSRTHYMKHDNKGGGNKRSTTFMHRLIMGIDGQNWEAGMVDHKDFNGLNNTRLNLRVVNKSDNMLNRSRPPTTNTTGVLGVGRLRGKWRATISYRKKFRHLGLFDSKVEAEKAVLAAREKLMTGDEEVIKNVMRPRETLGERLAPLITCPTRLNDICRIAEEARLVQGRNALGIVFLAMKRSKRFHRVSKGIYTTNLTEGD